MPNSSTAPASDFCKLEHKIRDPAITLNMVPGLVNASLLSRRNLASSGYTAGYDRKEINIYDGSTTKVIVSEEDSLKGWRCPQSTLWLTPLPSQVKNLNTDTLLLDSSDEQQSLNSLYEILRTTAMLEYLSIFMQDRPTPKISNISRVQTTKNRARHPIPTWSRGLPPKMYMA